MNALEVIICLASHNRYGGIVNREFNILLIKTLSIGDMYFTKRLIFRLSRLYEST